MKSAICLLVASSVSAFAPVSQNVRSHTIIYAGNDGKGGDEDKSQSLPFAPRPKLLDGTLAGDVGFDPFGLAGDSKEDLIFKREAEIKHSRLAMLAAVGWPIAELFDRKIAGFLGINDSLTPTGQAPSLLNGGLEKIEPEFWVILVSVAGLAEIGADETKEEKGDKYIPGDCGFDPLKLFPENKEEQLLMMTKEIKHGRIAMMAILGYVVQELLYNSPVTDETPFFFQPIF